MRLTRCALATGGRARRLRDGGEGPRRWHLAALGLPTALKSWQLARGQVRAAMKQRWRESTLQSLSVPAKYALVRVGGFFQSDALQRPAPMEVYTYEGLWARTDASPSKAGTAAKHTAHEGRARMAIVGRRRWSS